MSIIDRMMIAEPCDRCCCGFVRKVHDEPGFECWFGEFTIDTIATWNHRVRAHKDPAVAHS